MNETILDFGAGNSKVYGASDKIPERVSKPRIDAEAFCCAPFVTFETDR